MATYRLWLATAFVFWAAAPGRGDAARAIVEKAIQAHGGAGVSQDFHLAAAWANSRTLRIADGPDEVHREAVAKYELARYQPG